jgi:hypothetical protein
MAGTSPAMRVGTTMSRPLVIPGRRVSAGPGIQMLARCWFLDSGFACSRTRPGMTENYDSAPSTVTARRFCDQQEMSLHTATGRSFP